MNNFIALMSSAAVFIGFIGTLVGLYNSRHIRANTNETQRVAVNVNGNITALVSRIAQLTEIMTRHNVPVPPPVIPLPETEETI